jgi:hypothetical protein
MPDYEKFKYCGEALNGKPCGAVADVECTCTEPHPDEVAGWAKRPEVLADHPKWLCADCLDSRSVAEG